MLKFIVIVTDESPGQDLKIKVAPEAKGFILQKTVGKSERWSQGAGF
jgi:hypothetical protein